MVRIPITKMLFPEALVPLVLDDIVNSPSINLSSKLHRKRFMLRINLTKASQKLIRRILLTTIIMINSNSTIMRMKMITITMEMRMILPTSSLITHQEVLLYRNTCILLARELPSIQIGNIKAGIKNIHLNIL